MSKVYLFLFFVLTAVSGIAQNDGNPPNWCRGGFFTKGSPEFTLAKIPSLSARSVKRAYFHKDGRPDCNAGPDCTSSSYLVPGDEVVVRGELAGFACAWYPAAKGVGTVGWISLEDIEFQRPPSDQPLPDWHGEWKYAESTVKITDNKLAGWLNVTGDSYWKGLGDNIHIGEIDGRVEPKDGVAEYSDGDDEYDCKVKMTLLGKYLILDDNLRCGGVNVSFSVIYLKK